LSGDWLEVVQGDAPLVVSIPHAGTEIPEEYAGGLKSLWLARRDADWWLPQLYWFAEEMGATVVRTHISRTIVDVNRDPSGASLYPGQAVTGLCPAETFDGEALYRDGCAPDEAEIVARRVAYFEPYHAALAAEIARLRRRYARVVVYDCHSIRSRIPRLFEGVLPNFNIGTNDDKACDPALTARIAEVCAGAKAFTQVVNGRFKGGWITRHHGNPSNGVHAMQMELACRGYMAEPQVVAAATWPSEYDTKFAKPLQDVLRAVLQSVMDWSVA
jgi:formiminoglutamase